MKNKELFILSIVVFMTIFAWILIDIYHIQEKINEQIDIKPASVPNYQMDKKIIDALKAKKE